VSNICGCNSNYPKDTFSATVSFLKETSRNAPEKVDCREMQVLVKGIRNGEVRMVEEFKIPTTSELLEALWTGVYFGTHLWLDKNGNRIAVASEIPGASYDYAVYAYETGKIIGYIKQLKGVHYYDICGEKVHHREPLGPGQEAKLCPKKPVDWPSNPNGMQDLINILKLDFSKIPDDLSVDNINSKMIIELFRSLQLDPTLSLILDEEYDSFEIKNSKGIMARFCSVGPNDVEVYNADNEYIGTITMNNEGLQIKNSEGKEIYSRSFK
jgi:hypothetical protein